MKKLFIGISAMVLFFAIVDTGWSAEILTFEFSALAGNEETAASNSNDANLGSSTISRGSGLTATNNADRFNAESWALTSISNAVSGNDYMEFTITPNSGYQFSVSSIYLQLQRSGTGPSGIAIRSSVDNYGSNLDQEYSITDNENTQNFTFTFTQSNSSSAVTYRIYMWAEAVGGSGGIGDGSGNDIIVNGTTSASDSPTATLSADPALSESNLNDAEVDIALSNDTFVDETLSSSNFTLNNAPTGVTIKSIVYVSATTATVTLAFNGTDFDADVSNFNITIATAELTSGSNLTSSNLTITAIVEEPSNHVTGFSAILDAVYDYSRIDLSWTENDGSQAADGYLIKASTANNITDPVDETAVSDNTTIGSNSGAKNISYGTTSYEWIGLSAEQTYYFKIYPYTNSGTAIDYKTDGTVPSANATTDAAPEIPNIIISEIMQNPNAVNDDVGEWFEIYNASGSTVNINGWVIKDNGTDSHTIDNGGTLNIVSGGFLVLGRNSNSSTNGNVTVHYQYSGITLGNNDDEIILCLGDGTTEVDRVEYDGGTNWPNPVGASMVFTGTASDNNNSYTFWTTATTVWSGSAGDKGSPGYNGSDQSLPVSLQDFNAIPGNAWVTLSWITESETENLGFNLYRSTALNGQLTIINNQLIPGHGSTSEMHEYSYIDRAVVNGVTYYYKLEDVDYAGKAKLHEKVVSATPTSKESDANINQFRLYPCYPNPFNSSTNIRISLPETAPVKLQVYNLNGELISMLVNTSLSAGEYSFTWNATDFRGTDVASGVYFIRMAIENQSTSLQKVLLVR